MARGTTLGQLVDDLRTEANLDPNPALSLNMVPMMKRIIRRTQERLYDEFDWPFLKVRRDVAAAAGQRYYDVPNDMNLERITQVDYRWGDRWLPVERGITLDNFSSIDSDADARADPIMRWDVIDAGSGLQIEVWPIPATDGLAIRFTGLRNLNALTSDSDRAELDDMMIVLYAAGEMLGSAKSEVGRLKLAMGKARADTLRGRVIKRRNNGFILGGEGGTDSRPDPRMATPLVAYVRDA